MRMTASLVSAAFAVLGSLVVAATPASAGASTAALTEGSATIQGAGTISPGLTTTPTAQSFSFTASGPFVVANPSATGIYSCTVSGSSWSVETVAVGQGNLGGSCSGPTTLALVGSYTRYGEFQWLVTGAISGAISVSFTGLCSGSPSSAPTVSSFRVVCQLVLS